MDTGGAGEHLDEHRHVAADEWLAAREPHLLDAHAREQVHEPGDLFEAQHLLAVEPLEAFRRHAVAAAEVAFVRHRDAQRLDLAAPGVA